MWWAAYAVTSKAPVAAAAKGPARLLDSRRPTNAAPVRQDVAAEAGVLVNPSGEGGPRLRLLASRLAPTRPNEAAAAVLVAVPTVRAVGALVTAPTSPGPGRAHLLRAPARARLDIPRPWPASGAVAIARRTLPGRQPIAAVRLAEAQLPRQSIPALVVTTPRTSPALRLAALAWNAAAFPASPRRPAASVATRNPAVPLVGKVARVPTVSRTKTATDVITPPVVATRALPTPVVLAAAIALLQAVGALFAVPVAVVRKAVAYRPAIDRLVG